MKKILVIVCIFALPVLMMAQDDADTTLGWKKGMVFGLNFSQASFSNWAGGGENSIAGNAILVAVAQYKGNKDFWNTGLFTTYGMIMKGGSTDKSDDKLEINSLYGYEIGETKWFYSGIMNFKSQFTAGYAGPEKNELVSNFMAPGYLNLGLGVTWKPADYFSLNIAPADAKFVFVLDQYLADKGDYGVEPAVYDENGNKIKDGKNMWFQFGAYVRLVFNKEVFKNVNVLTTLDLFSNYLEKPQNIDVNWDVLITMKINSWLSASLNTTLIYDDDVTFTRVLDDGTTETYGPRTQFKEVFNLGLTFSLGDKFED